MTESLQIDIPFPMRAIPRLLLRDRPDGSTVPASAGDPYLIAFGTDRPAARRRCQSGECWPVASGNPRRRFPDAVRIS